MANEAIATNVAAGKPKLAGAISFAATSTTLPTTAAAALDAGFVSLGYCSEDGLTNTQDRSITDIKAWGGDIVLSVQDQKTDTFSFTLIESLNTRALKAYFGDDNVTGDLSSGITVNVNSKELTEKAWVVDMILRGALKRIVIPNGKVTATESITYSDGAAVGLGVTVTAYPDSSGNTHYEYIKSNTST